MGAGVRPGWPPISATGSCPNSRLVALIEPQVTTEERGVQIFETTMSCIAENISRTVQRTLINNQPSLVNSDIADLLMRLEAEQSLETPCAMLRFRFEHIATKLTAPSGTQGGRSVEVFNVDLYRHYTSRSSSSPRGRNMRQSTRNPSAGWQQQ
jgi:hypothetical protein